jgi:hypothetical protein
VIVGVGTPPNRTEELKTEPTVVIPDGIKTWDTEGRIKLAGTTTAVAVEVSEVPTAFVADTLNVYFKPFVKVFAKVQANGVGNGTFNVHVNAGLIGTPFSSYASTSYLVIAEPPVFGSVKLTVADPFPADATTFVGVEGLPTGVTAVEATDGPELPTPFLAIAVNVYGVPLLKPDISHPALGFVVTHVNPPGDEVTIYSTIADPPLSVGAVNVTVAFPGAVDAPVTLVGATEIVAGVTAIDAVEESDVYAPLFAWTANVTAVPLASPETVQAKGLGKVGVSTHICPVEAVTV